MPDGAEQETLAEFAGSFSYGSRTDLNFKFLAQFSAEEAGRFFQELLWKVGDAADRDDWEPVAEHIYRWQRRGYGTVKGWTYAEGPFAPLAKPVAQARVALLTSSGHFVAGDDPQPFGCADMTQDEAIQRIDDFLRADPQLSCIPAGTAAEQLRVRHGGYDIRAVLADPNVAFPLVHLRDLAREGRIGELADPAYSFVGACAQTPLLKRTGPQWVEQIQQAAVDAVVLVPV